MGWSWGAVLGRGEMLLELGQEGRGGLLRVPQQLLNGE